MNKEFNNAELVELQKELSRLKEAADHIDSAKEAALKTSHLAEELVNEHEKYLKVSAGQHDEMVEKNEQLIKELMDLMGAIGKINFPARMDKLDTTITSYYHGLQNIQTKLDNLGGYIKDTAKETKREVVRTTIEGNEKILNNLLLQNKKVKKLEYILYSVSASVVLIFGALAYIILK